MLYERRLSSDSESFIFAQVASRDMVRDLWYISFGTLFLYGALERDRAAHFSGNSASRWKTRGLRPVRRDLEYDNNRRRYRRGFGGQAAKDLRVLQWLLEEDSPSIKGTLLTYSLSLVIASRLVGRRFGHVSGARKRSGDLLETTSLDRRRCGTCDQEICWWWSSATTRAGRWS